MCYYTYDVAGNGLGFGGSNNGLGYEDDHCYDDDDDGDEDVDDDYDDDDDYHNEDNDSHD